MVKNSSKSRKIRFEIHTGQHGMEEYSQICVYLGKIQFSFSHPERIL